MQASKNVVRNRQIGFALLFMCAFSTYLNVGLVSIGLLRGASLVWAPSQVLTIVALATGLAGAFLVARRPARHHLPAMA